MTRKELSVMMGEKSLFSSSKCAEFVKLIFEALSEALERKEKIKKTGVGNFVVREKAARRGRNPQTDEKMDIVVRRVVIF